uniref:Transmembrane protein n=1 Tax=Haemonchus contortus TaxID=6289 RepID=A0A7I5E8B2_HAECO
MNDNPVKDKAKSQVPKTPVNALSAQGDPVPPKSINRRIDLSVQKDPSEVKPLLSTETAAERADSNQQKEENHQLTSSGWGESDDTVQFSLVADRLHIKVANWLMLCGLAQDAEILWNFAKFVMERGGIIGIIIMILLFFRAAVGIHYSYPIAKHIFNLIDEPEATVTCTLNTTSLKFARYCVSLVNDMKCKKDKGSGFIYYGTRCTDNTNQIITVTSIAGFYAEGLRSIEPPTEYDVQRLLYIFVICLVIVAIGVTRFTVVRYVVAIVFAFYSVIFLAMVIPFFSMSDSISSMMHSLLIATTPESLFEFKTYFYALLHAIKSGGLGLSAFLCASSFRSRGANSFLMTYMTILVNVLFGLISVFYFLCIINAANHNVPMFSKHSDGVEGFDFIFGTLTEIFIAREKSVAWLILYNFAVYLTSVSAFCGCLISLYGFVRDHAQNDRRLWMSFTTVIYALAIFVYSSLGGWVETAEEWRRISRHMFTMSIYIIVASMVVVFIHIYGAREYIIDLCEVFVLEEGQSPVRSATNSWQFAVFNVVPFLYLIIQANVMPATLRQHSRLENVWSDSLTKVVINALGIIVVISFGWRLYNNVKDDKGLSSFFTITPEHISYKRISSGWKTSRKSKDAEDT